ncbi:GNAT family N-acetyltransferase [Epilithonimonas mollis]|uniref:Acetyltransferase (GNAT) domain-containing protein n=1 Tax=Epilithonimonas mollis TaxID=216903 RepID=A0A1M6N1X7_9FLAO|nr:GNAT family N-acetyltransferase [Epilithonimonas mollis]SHJ89717.1 Acetyltransferase (GNAT) domain-containing protein [Epilithonimonas mollis]
MIKIVGLNKAQLKGFTKTEQFKQLDFAPISELREISHIHNPRAANNDVLLFLAYEDEQLAGYLGMLPDDVTDSSGNKIHFGWLSTLLVSEKFRGKQIAQKLLYAAEESYDKNLLITEFTPSAERLYRKIGLFEDLTSKKAIRYYFKSNLSELLPAKKVFFEKNRRWLKRLDNFLNSFIPYLGNDKNDLYKISKSADKNLEKFISSQRKNPIARNTEEFRWILDYPWLSNEKEQPDYLFSSFARNYEMFWVSVFENREIISSMLCSVRNGHLKILYYFGKADRISNILPKIIKKYKVKMMTVYDEKLNSEIRKTNTPKSIYKRPLQREYLIHRDFKSKLGKDFSFDFTDGDGDFAFT